MRKITFIFMFWCVLLKSQTDSITDSTIVIEGSNYLDWFNYPSFFIGLGIGLLLLFYSYYQRKSVKYTIPPSKTRKREGETEETWGGFFKTFNEQPEAQELYDKLRRKIHPDRFPNNEEKRDLSTRLASELGAKKIHLDRLKQIEQEAIEKGLI